MAAGRERWFAGHPFPTCFVCGPDRDDGMDVFPVAHGDRFVATWTPSEAGITWPALDCPTSAPVMNPDKDPPIVLARLAAAIDEEPEIGEPHVLVSWELGREGRKRDSACVLFDAGGRALARSRALWIELQAGVGSAAVATTHFRTCPFCEATCGLEVTVEGNDVVEVRGDAEDVFSHGFICPKATGLKHLHEDGDRLTTPLVKQPDGSFAEAGWDEALRVIDERLSPILEEHGRDSVAVYVGNPSAHNLSALTYGPVMIRALGSKSVFTASTVDQMPKHVSSGLMFGAPLSIPVPDVDRTDHLMILGANPLVSNGSLLTAPDMRGRLRAIRERGGKVVVIDPRRTRTAEAADEHHFIRPGGDAHLLLGIAHTLFEEGLADPGGIGEHLNGLDEVEALARDFAPETVAGACGIEAGEIRRMARELAAADTRCGLRADRHLHPGVRRPCELAGRRGERAHRQPRPARRGDVHEGGRGRAQHVRRARHRQGFLDRPLAEPRARAARGAGRAARVLPGRGDRHPRGGADPGAGHQRGKPAASRRRTPTGWSAPSGSWTSCSRSTST